MAGRAKGHARKETGWGDVRWRTLLHLLKERPHFQSSRELARTLGMGHSKVAEVINFLLFQRALRQTETGFTVEWDRLAKIMGALRLPAAAPTRTLSLLVTQEEFQNQLHDAEIPHVLGYTTAANALAYFEPHPEICVFIEKQDVRKVVDALGASADATAGRRLSQEALRSHPRALLFTDKLERLDSVDTKLGKVTSLHQTYVDLLNFPLAGAHADFIRKAIENRWKREHPDPQPGSSP